MHVCMSEYTIKIKHVISYYYSYVFMLLTWLILAVCIIIVGAFVTIMKKNSYIFLLGNSFWPTRRRKDSVSCFLNCKSECVDMFMYVKMCMHTSY